MEYKKEAYDEALGSGQYEKVTGLSGKYDNVRRLWEDEVVRLFLQPYLTKLVDEKKQMGKGLRILDFGCGSGDGYELLMSVKRDDSQAADHANVAVQPSAVELYKGVDLNTGLIAQARSIYGKNSNMTFVESNFNDLDVSSDEPYDLYTASYGTVSHNNKKQNTQLLAKLAKHARNGSVIVCDWLGRYSYEWQTLWQTDLIKDQWMDYVISYIYPEEERKCRELSVLPLTLLSREEVAGIVDGAMQQSGVRIEMSQLFDRSVLVGRHIDTRDYNPHALPLRERVNSLFEPNVRTDLNSLLIDYVPSDGFAAANGFYSLFHSSWNSLVGQVITLLQEHDNGKSDVPLRIGDDAPLALRSAMVGMHELVSSAKWEGMGDVRANIIEPSLGYALRGLEMGTQQGIGCGHGLVAILEVKK